MNGLVHWAESLPGVWPVILLSMLPVSELRGAIPWAVFVEGMSYPEAYLLAVVGNFLPVVPMLVLLGPLERWLGRWRPFRRFFDWLFARTRRRGKLVERWEFMGLMLFVAIPLPVTGAWTGVAAAYLFGVPLRRAVPAIVAGILVAGIIVSLACAGLLGFWRLAAPGG